MSDQTSTTAVPAPAAPAAPVARATDIMHQSDAEWKAMLGLAEPAPAAAKAPDPPPDAAAVTEEAPTDGAAPDDQAAAPVASEGEGDEAAAPDGDAPVELVKGEDGKWHRADGTFASAEEAAAADAQLAESAVPAEAPAPAKPKGFTVTDASGKEVDTLPDIRVTYTANGKVRENVPLDKLVRQAQSATFTAETQSEAVALKTRVAEIEQQHQSAQQELEQFRAWYAQLLADESDQFYITARDQYRAQNTPEMRARRAEEQLAALQQDATASRSQQDLATAVQTRLAPSLAALVEQHPHVTPDEVFGRFSLLTAPLLRNGRVPTDAIADVERIIANDLTHWVQGVSEQRAEAQAASAQARDKAIQRERVKVTLLKNQQARQGKPTGVSPGVRPAQKPTAYKRAEDILSDPQLFGGSAA